MPVTLDTSGSSLQTATATLTVALTIASNAVLLAIIGGKNTGHSVSAVDLGGVPLTRLGLVGTSDPGGHIEIWGLTAPAAGAGTLRAIMGFSTGETWVMTGASFLGVAGINPFSPVQTATTSAITVTMSLSTSNTDMVVVGYSCIQGTSAANITTILTTNTYWGFRSGYTAAAATTTSLSAILQGATTFNWATAAVSLRFSAAAASGATPSMCLLGVGF